MINSPIKISGQTLEQLGIHNPDQVRMQMLSLADNEGDAIHGNIANNTRKNVRSNITLTWNYISIGELELLMAACNIVIPNYNEVYPLNDLDSNQIILIEYRTFCGLRTIRAIPSATLEGELVDLNKGDGEEWRNFSLTFTDIADRPIYNYVP